MAGVQSKVRSFDLKSKLFDETNQEMVNQKLVEQIRSLEKDLSRANAYLNIKPRQLGMGISRKDFDAVTKENIRLKETLKHIGLTELGGKEIVNKSLEHGATLQDDFDHREGNTKQVNANVAVFNEEKQNLLKQLEEKEKLLQEKQQKCKALEGENENFSKRITELTTEVMKGNESKSKIAAELSETAKQFAEFQKKCAGVSNQVTSSNSKQPESEEKISTLKQSNENLSAQVSEKEAMIIMLRDQLKSYENDFRREREEKNTIKKKFKSEKEKNERMRREIQSHTATLRHFESEIDWLKKIQDDQNCMVRECIHEIELIKKIFHAAIFLQLAMQLYSDEESNILQSCIKDVNVRNFLFNLQ